MHPNESSLWWLVLEAISASAISIAAVAWLIQRLLSQWLAREQTEHAAGLQRESDRFKTDLEKEAERFRTGLEHENNTEIEKLRADLGRLSLEHQTRFDTLHSKQFEVIVELYKLIVRTQRTMGSYLAPFVPTGSKPEVERGKEAAEAWNVLSTFFNENEIYLDAETCVTMHTYLDELKKLHFDFQQKGYSLSFVAQWNVIWDKLNGNIVALKNTLADAFRKKIGVTP